MRKRAPFRFREIHPDNDSRLMNDLLWRFCRNRKIRMSRSRPYKKNDNAWIEQRNWTHVRKLPAGLNAGSPSYREVRASDGAIRTEN